MSINTNSNKNENANPSLKLEDKFDPIRVALKIVIVYSVLGILWILLSDKFVTTFIIDRDFENLVSIIKGWVYVLLTSLLLFSLVLSSLKKIQHAQEDLKNIAYRDSLTNLYNRTMLKDKLEKLETTDIIAKQAILFIDLDNFKLINDTFGHSFGDEVLIEIAKRLSLLDIGIYSLYRFGGDEFIILLEMVSSIDEIANAADKISKVALAPIQVSQSSIVTSFSIGISVYPDDGISEDELLKKADIAMYKAKNSGKNKFLIYNAYMNESVKDRVKIESYLRTSLVKEEFLLYYQPQYKTLNGEISGFEALVRWKSPELGLVPPNEFISIAEDTNLIVPLGKWILQSACAFIKNINEVYNKDYVISVNISTIQLIQDNFIDTINEVLDFSNLQSKYLELEITESVMMQSYEIITSKLQALRENNIRIALDDFGKGYSSFSYLLKLPITTLKIDKSFIDNIPIDIKSSYIVDAIISIAKKIGLTIVAEGVETKEQFQFLEKTKCDTIQGYYFSMPLPETQIKELLEKNKLFK